MVDKVESHNDKVNGKGESNSTRNMNSSVQCQSSQEYFEALEKWMHTVHMWQSVAIAFPYLCISNQCFPSVTQNSNPFGTASGANSSSFSPPSQGFHFPQGVDSLRNRRPPTTNVFRTPTTGVTAEGIEYRIPAIWKRFVAEFLDFLILFFIKVAVTFVAVDFFDVIDLDKYDFDLLNNGVKMDYKIAVEMTSEILIFEVMYRIVVCIFEAFWIRRGMGGRIGGATPGKMMMGIQVVLCQKVLPIEGRPADVILVYPGTDPGFIWAFARSFLKNLILAVLFPVCFALFFFKHSRTSYDILCHTIVVEENPRRNV